MIRIVFALIAAGLSSPAFSADWIEYKSENFTVYSDASSRDIDELLRDFEVFRLAALSVLNAQNLQESDQLVIVVFRNNRSFSQLAPNHVAGFFYHSIFGPRMIVGPGRDAYRQEILFHEYVHYLMNRHFSRNFPRWYSEGMASILESTRIYPSRIKIGELPEGFEYFLDGSFNTTVMELIDLEPDGMEFEFYITSWLLTHYLMLDLDDDGTRKLQTLEYLNRYDAGENPIEAFEASFGVTPSQMQSLLRRYLRGRQIGGLEANGFEYAGDIVQREMDEGEHLYLLGDIAIERDLYDAAYEFFDDFAEVESTVIDVRKVATRRAIGLIHQERIAEGDALLAPVLAADIHDPDMLADISHYAFDRYNHDLAESGAVNIAELERAIEYGKLAIEAAPTDLEALYYLGLSYELAGDLQSAVDTLLMSYDINPSVSRLNINLARVLIRGRQPQLATYLLNRLHNGTHDEDARIRLTEIMTALADDDYDAEDVVALLSN